MAWASDSPARTALASITMASASWSSIFCRRRWAIRRNTYHGPLSRKIEIRTANTGLPTSSQKTRKMAAVVPSQATT